MRFTWDYDRAEMIADGVVHAIGLGLGLVGATALVVTAGHAAPGGETAAVLIYASALLAMLGFSAAYNMWPVSRGKWLLRRFDHAAIYLLIAGTYTPFILHMQGGAAPTGLLAGIWSTAAVGIALKLLWPGRLDRFAVVLYLLLGWSGVVAYDAMAAALTATTLVLLAAGGVLYSLGVVFHLWAGLRFQNVIWHGCVLLASICHYTAVLDTVAWAAD
jgi:hemolysin III